MADFRGLMAVSEAVVALLDSAYRSDFNFPLEFRVFNTKDFGANKISNGASVFPYRIFINGTQRSPAGRLDSNGIPTQSQLPVELHFLVTLWSEDASLQNTLAGWVMRTLEDSPVLQTRYLNAAVPGVFRDDETVELAEADLSTEDLFRIWDVLDIPGYQLSIPYVARVIHLESLRSIEGSLVQQRRYKLAEITAKQG